MKSYFAVSAEILHTFYYCKKKFGNEGLGPWCIIHLLA